MKLSGLMSKNIDIIYHTGRGGGEVYGIVGRSERTNLQIIDAISTILDEKVSFDMRHPELVSGSNKKCYKSLITFVEDRASHNRRYIIDGTKIENEPSWKADENFDSCIVKTIDCYLEKYSD